MYMPTLSQFTALDPLPPAGEPVFLGRGPSDSNPYRYARNSPTLYTDPSGMDVFDYPDPDLRPDATSVADIDLSTTQRDLCKKGKPGAFIINISVFWHAGGAGTGRRPRALPLVGFNGIARGNGHFLTEGKRVDFDLPSPANPAASSTATASYEVKMPECPEGLQKPSRSIRVVDDTRAGARGWTGVSQIYRMSWTYECTINCDGDCQLKAPATYKVRREASNTVAPNLPLR